MPCQEDSIYIIIGHCKEKTICRVETHTTHVGKYKISKKKDANERRTRKI